MWKDHRWKQCTTKEILQISFQRCYKPWPENISYHVIFLRFVEEFHWIRSSYVCIFVYASDLKTGFSFVAQAIPFKDERHITDACFLTLFQKKNEKDEKMQWACLSLIWSGGLIGTRSYYCDGWSEKRINKLLNSYFIMPYKLYWSPFFISFNSC